MSDVLDLQQAVLDGGIRAVNFFTGRLLTGSDFSREQDARRGGDARLGRALGSGVVGGLEVELAPDKSTSPTRPVVRVFAGEAVNPCGQTLCLRVDAFVALTQQAAPSQIGDASFTDCADDPNAAGKFVSGSGVYILTIAPSQSSEGKAATNGLDPFNVRCNTDATVEGVQFRLFAVPPTWYASLDKTSNRFRSQLAALFFGNAEVDSLLARAQPPVDPGYAESGTPLTVIDQPLALIYFAANTLQFIDNHAVRRRVTRCASGGEWQFFVDDRRTAESEALFLDFQEQLAAIAKPLASAKAVRAGDWLATLPPAGVLPTGANQFDWSTFFGSAAPGTTFDLDRGLVRAVLRHSFTQEATAIGSASGSPYHVYRVVGANGVAPYVVFARSSLAEVIAADVGFDNRVCNLPNASNVQTAIEELWKLTRCGCSIVVAPGAGWEKAFDQIPAGGDAEVCFQAGDYPLTQPLVISNRRYLKFSGAGPGTVIHANGAERALVFDHCTAVQLSDLGVRSGALGSGGNVAHIGGAVTLTNCPQVVIERLTLECAGDGNTQTLSQRAASCLTVANAAGSSAGQVRVRSCSLTVGRQQVGMQLVNVKRAQIEDNVLRVRAQASVSWAMLDADYQAALVRRVFSDAKTIVAAKKAVTSEAPAPKAVISAPAPKKAPAKKAAKSAAPSAAKRRGRSAPARKTIASAKAVSKLPARKATAAAAKAAAAPPGAAPTAAPAPVHIAAPTAAPALAANEVVKVTYNGISVSFRTAPALARDTQVSSGRVTNSWQQLVDQLAPKNVTKASDLLAALGTAATNIMAAGKAASVQGVAVDKFGGVVNAVFAQEVPAGAQGIVVAGQTLDEIRIVDNLVDGFVQGIHIAASQRDPGAPTRALQAGNVIVRNNTVRVALPSSATRERHGIFVGNCASLAIQDNRLSAQQSNPSAPIRIEGIRVWGATGRRMFVRGNHLSGFAVGVRFWPTNLTPNATPSTTRVLWSIAENLFEGSTTTVQVQPRVGKVPIPANVSSFVQGLATNIS